MNAEYLLKRLAKNQASGRAPKRALVVDFLKAICGEARLIPLDDLAKTGSIHPYNPDFPLRSGVDVQALITGVLLQIDWVDGDKEISAILQVAIQLDQFTDDRDLWLELFRRIDDLEQVGQV